MFGANCALVIHFSFSKLICERLMLQSCIHGGNGNKCRYNLRIEDLNSWYHPLHVNQITFLLGLLSLGQLLLELMGQLYINCFVNFLHVLCWGVLT